MESPHSFPPPPSPSSSPSPSPCGLHLLKLLFLLTPSGQVLRIQFCVLLTVILLVVLSGLGWIRRYFHAGWLRYVTRSIYIFIPFFITYIIGLMYNASIPHVLYPVWAAILVYAYSGAPNTTAWDLSDNDNVLPYLWQTLTLIFWTILLSILNPISISDSHLRRDSKFTRYLACYLIILMALWNTLATAIAFYLASNSKGLPGFVRPIVEHMSRDPPEGQNVDQTSVMPCDYMVNFFPQGSSSNTIITIDRIWGAVSEDHSSSRDMCLPFAMFGLILRRFAHFPIRERCQPKTRKFVRVDLSVLPTSTLSYSECVFNIIEKELSFLFDFFYTKSFSFTGQLSSYYLISNLACFVLLLLFGIGKISLTISSSTRSDHDEGKNFDLSCFGHSMEIGVTRIVLLIFCGLEFWKISMACFSDEKAVWALCALTREDRPAKWFISLVEGVVLKVWTIKHHLCKRFVCLSKPWQRRLGQYSFLDNYDKTPILARMLFFIQGTCVKLSRAGQCGETSVALSTQVKEAIFKALSPHVQENELALSRGTATIQRHQLQSSRIITISCELTDIHVIIVWHVATCICELICPPQNTDDPNFLVATQLSKYCAYLVYFAPELLPGHHYTTERDFNRTVKSARAKLIMNEKSEQLNNECDNIQGTYTETNIDTFLAVDTDYYTKSVILAAELRNQVMNSQGRGWKFMEEVWAELLLYMAPSDKVAEHGEYLARGGEFITHIWALLNHAGIVERIAN